MKASTFLEQFRIGWEFNLLWLTFWSTLWVGYYLFVVRMTLFQVALTAPLGLLVGLIEPNAFHVAYTKYASWRNRSRKP